MLSLNKKEGVNLKIKILSLIKKVQLWVVR